MVAFWGCDQDDSSSSQKILQTYTESPRFIRDFLDSASGGSFRIAEKGAAWNGGCSMSGHLPCRQFVSASLNNGQYRLEYLIGGIMIARQSIVINFKNRKVLTYSLEEVNKREQKVSSVSLAK